jgi:hypothetical protein
MEEKNADEKELELDRQIKELKEKIYNLTNIDSKQEELGKLKNQLRTLEFRTKHKKLLKFTNKYEKGVKGFFKGMGKAIKTGGKALEKSDAYLEKKKLEEAEARKKLKNKKSMTNTINDELNAFD